MFNNIRERFNSYSPYQIYTYVAHLIWFSQSLPLLIISGSIGLFAATSSIILDLAVRGKLSQFLIDTFMKGHLRINLEIANSNNPIISYIEQRWFLNFQTYYTWHGSNRDPQMSHPLILEYPTNDEKLLILLNQKLNEWGIDGNREIIAGQLLQKLKEAFPIIDRDHREVSFQHYLQLFQAFFKDILSAGYACLSWIKRPHFSFDPLLYRSPTLIGNIARGIIAFICFSATLTLLSASSLAFFAAFPAGILGFTLLSYGFTVGFYGSKRFSVGLVKDPEDSIGLSGLSAESSGGLSRLFGITDPYGTTLSDLEQSFVHQLNHLLTTPENTPPEKHQKRVAILAKYFTKVTIRNYGTVIEMNDNHIVENSDWDKAHVEDKVEAYQRKKYFKVTPSLV